MEHRAWCRGKSKYLSLYALCPVPCAITFGVSSKPSLSPISGIFDVPEFFIMVALPTVPHLPELPEDFHMLLRRDDDKDIPRQI